LGPQRDGPTLLPERHILRICAQVTRTEGAPNVKESTVPARQVGTYVLVVLDVQNAGSGARENEV
jgi:hypothetical protein